ncbi:MAG TPA: DUF350 domain-containing protein [Chloroflexia bacterium]|nr:DUF350 domain-containing protein [Chloroflexia bacterium]
MPTTTVTDEVRIFVISMIYAVVGMGLLYLGYRVFDWLTPTDMQKKIFEEGNRAVAITVGAFILGLAIIIAAAIHG